jgi:hypothetical protein
MTDDPDATQRALEHDVEVLEDKAISASKAAAIRILPIAAGVLGLLVLAWIAGRRMRNRAERRRDRRHQR